MKTFATTKQSLPPVRQNPAPALGPSSTTQRAEVRQILHGLRIQPKLTIGAPNDSLEHEADRVAAEVGRRIADERSPAFSGLDPLHGASRPSGEIRPLRESGGSQVGSDGSHLEAMLRQADSRGRPLDDSVRQPMEHAFGVDFGSVRVHDDAVADQLNRAVGSRALTAGRHIFFGRGAFEPAGGRGRELIAHELTHVVQQSRTSSPLVHGNGAQDRIQRRLVMFGTLPDVNALLGLLGPRAGLTLALNVANNQVTIAAVAPAAPPSPTLRARLQTIINDRAQHAEVIVARGQPGVAVGAFPQPSDLTVTRVQQIDVDDILAVEAGAPGNGVAFAMHEIEENYQAHGVPVRAGRDRFPGAHQQAITNAETPVAQELVGPGRRIATVAVPGSIVPGFPFLGIRIPGAVVPAANTIAVFFDYDNYYVGLSIQRNPVTADNRIINARRFQPQVVSVRTIDNFVSNSAALPAGGAATVALALADVAANPTATVRVRGFTDSQGSAAHNLRLSRRRAATVTTALGLPAPRVHSEGLGETNFVAPNATAADRARNRRVVITVVRPQL